MKSAVANLLAQTPDRLLTGEEEKRLTERAAAGDREARKQLVKHNHRLVVSIAKDYRGMGVDFEDLLMAGFEGLLEGINRFDPQLGNKLSTYVTWWIRQRILRELDKHSTTIRVPGYLRRLRRRINRLEEKREEGLTPAGIREEFGVSEEVAHKVKQVSSTASLDSRLSPTNRGNLKELIGNRKAKDPAKAVFPEESYQKLLAVMEEKLTDRERRVLKLYYGVEDYQPRTLAEVGEIFGLSRERIRQLRERALEKLREDKELAELRGE